MVVNFASVNAVTLLYNVTVFIKIGLNNKTGSWEVIRSFHLNVKLYECTIKF